MFELEHTRGIGIASKIICRGRLMVGVLTMEHRVVFVDVSAEEARYLAQCLLDDAAAAEECEIEPEARPRDVTSN